MKKSGIICAIVIVSFSMSVFSQVKYTSSGTFGIGYTTTPLSTLSIGSDGSSDCAVHIYSSNSSLDRSLRVHHYPTTDSYNYGIMGISGYNSNGWKICGIYASGHRDANTDGIYTYGVKAYAGRGGDGRNYAVMGSLVGSRDGAGIFGCSSAHEEFVIVGDYAGYFRGKVWVSDSLSALDITDRSDINAKKEVRSLGLNNLEKLNQLNGIKYKLKHPTELTGNFKPGSDTATYLPIDDPKFTKDRIGLIAQEVQEVYPELVGMDSEGFLTLNYIDLIPILIEAIKEQQAEIEMIQELINKNPSHKSAEMEEVTSSEDLISSAQLHQNIPNPFDENTTIKYSLPIIESYALINVYDLQGSQVKSYNITNTGDGEIMIPGSELKSGLFIYNLIVDGTEIDSRRMVLTD